MAIVFRTDDEAKWGSGLGRKLTNVEVDNNFWDLLQRVQALETNPVTPVSIEEITYESGAITVALNNASSYGPFVLPVATFTDRGIWANSTAYNYLDLVNVPTIGLFLVLVAHTTVDAPGSFDRELEDEHFNLVYKQLTGVPKDIAYDLGMNVIGAIPNDSSPLQIFLADRAVRLPAGLTGSRAYLLSGVTSETLVLPLEHNGTEVGTLTFENGPLLLDDSGGQPGVFTFPAEVTLAAGDRLVVRAPDTLDATAADLVVTIAGTRADL